MRSATILFCGITIYSKRQIILLALTSFVIKNTKSLSFGRVRKRSINSCIENIIKQVRPHEVAWSFIECKEDLEDIALLKLKYNFKIISKIETQRAVENIENIISLSDGIILGRGDFLLYGSLV